MLGLLHPLQPTHSSTKTWLIIMSELSLHQYLKHVWLLTNTLLATTVVVNCHSGRVIIVV